MKKVIRFQHRSSKLLKVQISNLLILTAAFLCSCSGYIPYSASEVFDECIETVEENFPGELPAEWPENIRKYRIRALKAANEEEIAPVINELLATLKVSHLHFFTSSDKGFYLISRLHRAREEYTGIGMDPALIDGSWYIRGLFENDTAFKAGLKVGDRLISVNDRPFRIGIFEGFEGKSVSLKFKRRANGPAQTVKIVPTREIQADRVLKSMNQTRLITVDGKRILYHRLWWMVDDRFAREFGDLISENAAEYKAQAIIIDIRNGYGGHSHKYLYPFIEGGTTKFTVIRRQNWFKNTYKDHFSGSPELPDIPLAVIINEGSRSAKEIFAMVIKARKRGMLIGAKTPGFVLGCEARPVTKKSTLLYARCFIKANGQTLEGIGVTPDIPVNFHIPYAAGNDPQLERAKEELIRQIH